MELTTEHRDLLRAVDELETPDRHPGTEAVGARLLQIWKDRGGPYSWHAAAPWHGTQPYLTDLVEAGLVVVDVGMAEIRRPDQPASTADEYWLSLTEDGRAELARGGPS